MFSSSSFNGDVSGWDVGMVTDTSWMFQSASSFNSDVSAWDVSSVQNMNGMFFDTSFNGDISSKMFWLTSSFNKDLCLWGPQLHSFTMVTDMFESTSCPNQGDPVLSESPPGPFCNTYF